MLVILKEFVKKSPEIYTSNIKVRGKVIIVGTIGKNEFIDQLIDDKKLEISGIENQWERFAIQTINKPFKGVKQALVIAGSDKRGTAYGLFTLSKAMGVSPWYWWADVPVKKHPELYIPPLPIYQKLLP